MRRSIGRRGIDGGAILRDGAIQIASLTQALAGICSEDGSLQIGFSFGERRAGAGFFSGGSGLALLAENGCESGVGPGKIGFQANGFAQSGSGVLELGLLFQYGAERVVSLSVIGFGVNGCLQLGYRGIQVTLLPESDAESIGSVGLRRIDRFGFTEFADGFR